MNWGDLGKTLLSLGLPSLGTALLGPLGGTAGKVIADALGVPATPAAVSAALSTDPEVQKKLADDGFESPKVRIAGQDYQRYVAMGALKAARAARENQWQVLLG